VVTDMVTATEPKPEVTAALSRSRSANILPVKSALAPHRVSGLVQQERVFPSSGVKRTLRTARATTPDGGKARLN
jgi:hypothetical protein